MVPNIDGTMGHKIKTRKHPRHGSQWVIQYPTNRNPAQSLQVNALTVFGLICTTRWQNIGETSKVLKLKNSNLSSTNFWSSFLISQKCQTMSPHQEGTASSTNSLIWGLKEFTEVVESPTRPWSSLICFETTPSIQVSMKLRICYYSNTQHLRKALRRNLYTYLQTDMLLYKYVLTPLPLHRLW